MNLQTFIQTYQGNLVEVAGSANAKYQCVDLANAYIRDVLGAPMIEYTNAQDFPKKTGDAYDWIVYTAGLVPEPGDIMIWNFGDGVGHIAIFVEGNASTFTSFDQNYPLNSSCHLQSHTYKDVVGWLRFKELTQEDMSKVEDHEQAISAIFARLNAIENLDPKGESGETKLIKTINNIKRRKFGISKLQVWWDKQKAKLK